MLISECLEAIAQLRCDLRAEERTLRERLIATGTSRDDKLAEVQHKLSLSLSITSCVMTCQQKGLESIKADLPSLQGGLESWKSWYALVREERRQAVSSYNVQVQKERQEKRRTMCNSILPATNSQPQHESDGTGSEENYLTDSESNSFYGPIPKEGLEKIKCLKIIDVLCKVIETTITNRMSHGEEYRLLLAKVDICYDIKDLVRQCQTSMKSPLPKRATKTDKLAEWAITNNLHEWENCLECFQDEAKNVELQEKAAAAKRVEEILECEKEHKNMIERHAIKLKKIDKKAEQARELRQLVEEWKTHLDHDMVQSKLERQNDAAARAAEHTDFESIMERHAADRQKRSEQANEDMDRWLDIINQPVDQTPVGTFERSRSESQEIPESNSPRGVMDWISNKATNVVSTVRKHPYKTVGAVATVAGLGLAASCVTKHSEPTAAQKLMNRLSGQNIGVAAAAAAGTYGAYKAYEHLTAPTIPDKAVGEEEVSSESNESAEVTRTEKVSAPSEQNERSEKSEGKSMTNIIIAIVLLVLAVALIAFFGCCQTPELENEPDLEAGLHA